MMLTPPKIHNLAIDHVDWFIAMLRPLLLSHFEHGFKHGVEDVENDIEEREIARETGRQY